MACLTRRPRFITSANMPLRSPALISNGKRKADFDDAENVDPTLSAKRSKTTAVDANKAPVFYLSRSAATSRHDVLPLSSPTTKTTSAAVRPLLQRKSPTTGIAKSTPLSAPAGRSPTGRGKRSGLLSRSRRYTRIEPPAFRLGSSSAPFSLDAAVKGTISSYSARPSKPLLPEAKASWHFDIHEDTPEQEMTNLLQHGTCILDISSDEENERKAQRDSVEGRNKENIAPADDVSQTPVRHSDAMPVDKERVALGEMNTADFYPKGCDETSVVLIPADEELPADADAVKNVEQLMRSSAEEPSAKAAVLEPLDGTGESFDLWESGSAKDESRGALIVLEGLDRNRSTPIGQLIDSYLRRATDMNDHAIHLLFSANRWEAAKHIRELLAAGTSVICDRFYHSGIVYSAAKDNPELSLEWARGPDIGLPRPDAVIFLDLDEEQAKARGGWGCEAYEEEQMQRRVRELFSTLTKGKGQDGEDLMMIDARGTVDEVAEQVWERVLTRLKLVDRGELGKMVRTMS
ncbi:hypothetical protein L249_7754 [Ophiocordyceps polyrhachis-furcata BCC 54312]|uniref:dTMP kinase n=1 Tax=Ophiocordyceps polyrhachis-furcata BCC 54312 TaxID=1330021 RepID=A0A367LB03_9HYPO|nr:hypothetical protein L249_7754 [Ophiocordyceps polyrhachis-furcata BCC 54312]